MATQALDRPSTRALRLKQATHALHEKLDQSIMLHAPFAHRDRYAAFAEMQYRFLAKIEPLYHDERFGRIFTGLKARSRLAAARLDLCDLGRAVPAVEPQPIGGPEGLGWLYVSEGSTLGAAFLLKAAEKIGLSESFGARHLAGAPEGRGRHWRRFTAELDAPALSSEEEARAAAGAVAAFAHVQELVDLVLPLDLPSTTETLLERSA